jgi:hypothetical protein
MNGASVWKSFPIDLGTRTLPTFPHVGLPCVVSFACVCSRNTAAADDAGIIIEGAHF